MFLEEAIWIRKNLFSQIDKFDTILDIGSSSYYFRSVTQPFIEEELFKPLREAGKKICHMDKKPEIGVDLILDIEDLDELEQQFDVVLCCNVLEHVTNPDMVALKLENAIMPNGYLIVTIPYSYPYHCDPFDNLWRPNPSELIRIFHWCNPLETQIIKVKVTPYKFVFRRILSLFETFYIGNPRIIIRNLEQTFRHPFSISCAFFSKNPQFDKKS